MEPNDDMRNTAIEELKSYKKFSAVSGTATETMLSDNSVYFITVAQAFHWFDIALFKKECKRILKDKGLIFLIWNMRDMTSEFVILKDVPQVEKEKGISPELRAIRLDVVGFSEVEQVLALEMQQKNTYNIPKRSRFYQGLVDVSLLEPGKQTLIN